MALSSHDDHFAAQTDDVRRRLVHIQREVQAQVPGAVPTVSYQMPAFRMTVRKTLRTFIYFAAFKRHIGIYPPVMSDEALIRDTAAFRGPKGNLSFGHDQPLPEALIARVVAALAAQARGP